ncbi:MAG: gephyrin-like molybdotransferase Glp [Candidatus Hydrothermarchaeales archaeon]
MAMRGFRKKISLKEARRIVLDAATEIGVEEIKFADAISRVLAEDVVSEMNNPPFDRAMMDGYAVISEDTKGASTSNPGALRIVGSISIGESPTMTLKRGEALKIMTGAPIPKGADSVLRLEYSEEKEGEVKAFEPIPPGKDISPMGEDIKTGEVVLEKGRILKPGDLGALAATGNVYVKVRKMPKVAIVSTGSELLEPGEEVRPGSIYDINTYTLSTLVKGIGGSPIVHDIIRDDEKELEELLKSDFDVLILSGATSVGEKDFVPEVIARHGEILFHGVNVRPGSPVGFGVVEGRPVFMLPGFPVSCIIAFELLVTPFLQKMLGTDIAPPHHTIKGILKKPIRSQKGRVNFVRVQVFQEGGRLMVSPVASKGSSLITTLTKADGFVLVDENRDGIKAGERVTVYLF